VHQEQDYSKVGDMKNKIQMVDDDQVENVGIMSGFMDDLEGLLEELSAEEMEGMEEGDEADMARTMKRSPDSPEILMNNLRGDMRSIDARREELSDLVGFREAEETPEGVLALLQPILGQQAAPMMPPQGMPCLLKECHLCLPQGMPYASSGNATYDASYDASSGNATYDASSGNATTTISCRWSCGLRRRRRAS
jgi:hypothetical protein